MKRLYILGTGIILASATVLVGCSDDFLKEKKAYGQYDEMQIYGNFTSAEARVNNLYTIMMPQSGSGDGVGIGGQNDYTPTGYNDQWTKTTLEYGGFSQWVDPDFTYTNLDVPDWFYVNSKSISPWGGIRECNDILEKVPKSPLTEDEKKQLMGQAYFFRAFRYWTLTKLYGGVPLIDHVQNPIVGDGDGSDKVVPRGTTKECVQFICADLDKAAAMLPARWENAAEDFGRITAGAALALKGRVQLFYASPLFNRANDKARWDSAYVTNKAALEKLKEGGFGLAYSENPGTNGSNWASIFSNYTGSDPSGVCEAVLVSMFNNHAFVDHYDYDKWNNWEQSIRPSNTNGAGALHPTSEMVDLFPMADGKKPSESIYTYDRLLFWLNRDPRFYRTFSFPGVEWRFSEGSVSLSGEALKDVFPSDKYSRGSSYQLWSYTWYDNEKDAESNTVSNSAGFTAQKLNTKNSAIYLRKKSDDLKLSENPLYIFSSSANRPKGFQRSAAPIIVMRYAEVLLNFAEAACGAGHQDEAIQALKDIRARVGYTADNNYGLDPSALTDEGKLFGAILYERQIELAYEGKAADDVRRWMLYDGGTQKVANAPSTWTLTGFGGNTCTFTGIKPLNGQRRHEMILYTTITAPESEGNNPLEELHPMNSKNRNDWGFDLTESFLTDPETGELLNPNASNGKVQAMATFYNTYLKRKDINADGNDEAKAIDFKPQYYFLGLKQSAQSNNSTLLQTIGWNDFSHGGEGTFDPLAE